MRYTLDVIYPLDSVNHRFEQLHTDVPTPVSHPVQGPVVRKVDNAIHWINLYPLKITQLISPIPIHWIAIYSAIQRLSYRSLVLKVSTVT